MLGVVFVYVGVCMGVYVVGGGGGGGCHTNTSLCTQSWGVSHRNLTVCTCSVLKLDQCGEVG